MSTTTPNSESTTRSRIPERDRSVIPPGQVTAELHSGGAWVLVSIGRERGVRRFNLARSEAVQLAQMLAGLLPESRDGAR